MTAHEQHENVIPFRLPSDDVDPSTMIEANIRLRLDKNLLRIFYAPGEVVMAELAEQGHSDRVVVPERSPTEDCRKVLIRKFSDEGIYALALFRDDADSQGKYQDWLCWFIDITGVDTIEASWVGEERRPSIPESPRLRDVTRLGLSELEIDLNNHKDIKDFMDRALSSPLNTTERDNPDRTNLQEF